MLFRANNFIYLNTAIYWNPRKIILHNLSVVYGRLIDSIARIIKNRIADASQYTITMIIPYMGTYNI